MTSLVYALGFAALSAKHKGFREEREWRVICSPVFGPSELVKSAIEVVNGIPQTVFKIPLETFPRFGLTELAIPNLIERVIIGPSAYPETLKEAFVALLTDAGVPNARGRVTISDIPLRT